jgi:hypothetical protein
VPHLRTVLLAALAIVLSGPGVGVADRSGHDDGRLLPPAHRFAGMTGGELLGAWWSHGVSTPIGAHPAFGNADPCVRFGRKDKLLAIYGGTAHCTVEQGTTVFVNGFSGFCSDVEEPPFFGADEAAQRECILALLPPVVESINVVVDRGDPVNLLARRYAVFAPQQTADLPDDNILGLPPHEAITFTPFGWEAWLTKLSRGRHTVTTETLFNDGSEPHATSHVIDVVRR